MARFNRRYSPQGRHVPSDFITMCRGADQLLDDRRIMPSFSSLENSAFGAASLAGSRLRNRSVAGGPAVCM